MPTNAQLLLIAKARRRRAEAAGAATTMPQGDHPLDVGSIVTDTAVPPDGLTPGSREYADWAAEQARAGKNLPQAGPAPPAPAPPSLIDTIMSGAKGVGDVAYSGVRGVSRGISNVIGLPGDLGTLLGRSFAGPGYHDMLPTGQDVQSFFHLQDSPDAQNFPQRLVARIGEEIGGMAIPEAGIVSTATRMGPAAVREAGGLAKFLLEPAAVNPAAAIGKDVSAAVAAGTGAGLANTAVDPNTPQGQWADLIGAITGVGVMGIGSHMLKSAGNVFNALRTNPDYVDKVVNSAVVDRIAKASDLPGSDAPRGIYDTQPLVDRIMAGRDGSPSKVIPGFQESLADRTGSPGIASIEYSRQSGPNAGAFIQRRGENTDAIDTAMRAVEPTETPGVFRSALEDERQSRLSTATNETNTARTDFDRYLQTLVPQTDAEARGATVRNGIANAERAARESERAAWERIHGEVDPAPLAEAIDQTRSSLPLARQDAITGSNATINIPRRLINPAGDLPAGPVDVRELNAMRSSLLYQQRAAQSAGDSNQVQALGQFIDQVSEYLASDAVPADVSAATRSASAASRQVNEDFNRPNDPLAAVLSAKEGRPNVPDSAVARTFVQPDIGQASNIDRLLAQTDLSSHGAAVRDALKDEIVAGIDRGRMAENPARLDKYLSQFGRVFSRFPELHDEVRAAAVAGRRWDAANSTLKAMRGDLGTPDGAMRGRGVVGRYLQHSDANSERAIGEVLAAKDPGAAADELMGFIGHNPQGVEGARAAFWQKLRSESQSVDNSQRSMGGGRAWRGDWLKSFLDKPSTRAVAHRLYRDNPDALSQIELYANVLDNVDLRQRGRAAGTSGTAQGVNPVLTPETLQSRVYAYLSGRVSGTYLVTSIAAVIARRAVRKAQTEAIERLTDKVLLNPDLAAELLKDNNPANRAALTRKAKTWFGNEASTILGLMNGEDDDETDEPAAPKASTQRGGDALVDMVMR